MGFSGISKSDWDRIFGDSKDSNEKLANARVKTGKMEAKFKYAEAKAKRDGVDSLTKEDVEGLSPEQMKQLRGY